MPSLRRFGDVWALECRYEERHIAQTARFRWHVPGGVGCRSACEACANGVGRAWWTPQEAKAILLLGHASGDVRADLEERRRKREESLRLSRAMEADAAVPAPEGLEYRPFQKAAIAYALEREGALIADEMGCGKTIEALGVVNADPSVRSVLVVCPARVLIHWEREARRWLVRPARIRRVRETGGLPAPDDDVVLVNYDKLALKQCGPLREALLAREWDLLVLDEAHRVKNPKAKRTRLILGGEDDPGLVARARRKLFLTGTPLLNRPVELQPLAGALRPDEFGDYWRFAMRYGKPVRTRYGLDVSGASNLDELQERLRRTVMVRRLKTDVLKELPPKVRQVVVVPADGARREIERETVALEAHRGAIALLRTRAREAKASGSEAAYREAVKALREGVSVAMAEIADARRAVALAKLPTVKRHVEALLEEGAGKVVVFGHHRQVTLGLLRHFGDAATGIVGGMSEARGDEAVGRFQTDPDVRVFVGSMKAAGEGLTLTASSVVVFAELDWTPATVSQCEDRLHRITQAEPVLVHHLVLEESLDARVAQMLVDKQEIMDRALDLDVDPTVPVLPFDAEEAGATAPPDW